MTVAGNRTFADVIQNIVQDIQEILRSEVRLARAEIVSEGKKATRAGTILIIGAVLGLYAVGLLLLAGVHGLSMVVPPWAAALSIGVVIGCVAALLVASGRRRLRLVHATPEKALGSMKENVQWLKHPTT